jgi:hypothetical protein
MGHYCFYILEKACDEEEARANVRSYLDGQCGERQWFDYGGIEREDDGLASPEKSAVPLSRVIPKLQEELKRVSELIVETRERCLNYSQPSHRYFNTGAEGYQHSLLAQLLCQEWCSNMPFWNMADEDWSLPEDPHEDDDGLTWWAVPVDLHA